MKRKYNKVLSFGASSEQIDKLNKISNLAGVSVSNIVRQLIDSALPEVDPTDSFWIQCKNSGIFNMNIPAETVTAFIASFLHLPLTGNNKIDNIEIKGHAPYGISPMLWALKQIQESFYDKSISNRTDKQDISEDDSEECGRTEPNQS